MSKKLSMEEMIQKFDDAKKTNPLDLSSDQDLTIALMNIISLEEHFFFTGAKLKKPAYYELMNTMRDIRKELMAKIVDKNSEGEIWCISKHLLAASMRLMEVGTKANCAGNKEEANNLFGKSYDLYSLFWGLNMDLISEGGVKELLPNIDGTVSEKVNSEEKNVKKNKEEPKKQNQDKNKNEKDVSLIARLGNWVKDSVNCCIE